MTIKDRIGYYVMALIALSILVWIAPRFAYQREQRRIAGPRVARTHANAEINRIMREPNKPPGFDRAMDNFASEVIRRMNAGQADAETDWALQQLIDKSAAQFTEEWEFKPRVRMNLNFEAA